MRRATKVFIALAAVVALVGSAVFWLWWNLRGVATAARTPRTVPRTVSPTTTAPRTTTTTPPRTTTTTAPRTVSPTTVAPTATAPRTPSPATTAPPIVTSPPDPVPAAAAEDDAYAPAPVPIGNVPLMTSAPTVSGAPEPGAWEAASFGTDF